MNKKVYSLVWRLIKPYYSIVYPVRAHGVEKLPKEGGFVLCLNHIAARDPMFFVSCMTPELRVRFLAKKELWKHRCFGKLFEALGAIPVDRGNSDLAAMRSCFQAVRDGYGLGIFPQGTRSRDNSPTPMLPGASMIAMRSGVKVYPVYIDGPYKKFRKTDLYIGDPLDFSDLGKRCDSETLQVATDRISGAIWGMKPQKQLK